MLGGLLALMAAATFALTNTSLRIGVLSGSVAQAMAISVPLGAVIFLAVTAAAGRLGDVTQFSSRAVLLLSLAGVVHFVWGRYCNFRATKAIGANLAAPVQQFSLILSLVLAVGVLGEELTGLQIFGILLVALGPAATMDRGRAGARPAMVEGAPAGPSPFAPRYAEGYLFAALSATGYGTSPILVRAALEGGGLGGSLAGGLVAYAAASVAIGFVLMWPGQVAHVRAMTPKAAKWFTLSGALVTLSQMFNYMALAVAPVSIVTPIMRLSLVFRVGFSWLFTRDHEVFGAGVIAGTLLSVIGAFALTMNTDYLVDLLALPAPLADLARWRWR